MGEGTEATWALPGSLGRSACHHCSRDVAVVCVWIFKATMLSDDWLLFLRYVPTTELVIDRTSFESSILISTQVYTMK